MLDAIKNEFTQNSAIAPDILAAAVEFTPDDLELDPYTNEPITAPLHELFGLNFTRFTQQVRTWALFRQETGEVWQAKIYGAGQDGDRSGKYRAPKGIGNRAYFPPVPERVRELIARQYNLTAPLQGESFWAWLLGHPQIPIVITEGAKKALAAISQGVITIAVYGCACGKSPDLIPFFKNRKIFVGFDRDTKDKAKKAVKGGTFAICRAVFAQEGTPRILNWESSLGKGLDDLAAAGINLKVLCTDSLSLSYQDYKEQHRENSLNKYKPVRVNQKYLDLTDSHDAQLIGLKSAKGTGKTEWLAAITQKAGGRGIPTIAIGHRIKLMVEMSRRLGIPYRTEEDEDGLKYLLGYCLCVNSLHPKAKPSFDPVYWGTRGAWVIIDEVEQVIWSLLNDSTLKDFRPLILDTLQTFLRETVANGGRVFLADADLSSRSLDFLLGLIGLESLEPWVIINDYAPPSGTRHLVSYEDPQSLLTELVAKAASLEKLGGDEKLWVATSSQKESSTYGSINLEKRLAEVIPPEQILRIDSQTVTDKNHPAYRATNDLPEIIKPYRVIITSPTLETGVDVPTLEFAGVFGFFSGVQTVNGACQALARVRGNCTRYIWAPEKHNMMIGGGDGTASALITREKRLAKVNLIELRGIEAELCDRDKPILIETWARYASEVNQQAWYYRGAILAKLQTEGYTLIDNASDPDRAELERELIKGIKEQSHREYCEGVAHAPAPDDITYQRLKDKAEKTTEERYQEERGRLARTYLTEDVTPPLVDKDSQGWLAQLTLTYYLTTGREFLEAREKAKATKLGKENQGRMLTTDLNRAAIAVQVKALELFKITQFLDLDPEKLWDNDSLAEWFALVTANRAEIKQIFGFWIGKKDTAISVAQRFLDKLGLKLKLAARRRVDGKLTRFYQLSTLDPDDRGEIFTRWIERDCATPPISIHIMGGVAHPA
jgi:hypothetical protein